MFEPTFNAEELHHKADGLEVPAVATVNALAWWVAAELVRRHPTEIQIAEESPWSGWWNALVVLRTGGPEPKRLCFLRLSPSSGFLPLVASPMGGGINWAEMLLVPNRRDDVVLRIEAQLGLTPPRQTPSTTARSIGPRILAAFLQRTSLERQLWAFGNGSSVDQESVGPNEELFNSYPLAAQDRAARYPDADRFRSSQHYWFIGPVIDKTARPPVTVINTTEGIAWFDGHEFDLLALYKRFGSKLDPVVNLVFLPAL